MRKMFLVAAICVVTVNLIGCGNESKRVNEPESIKGGYENILVENIETENIEVESIEVKPIVVTNGNTTYWAD